MPKVLLCKFLRDCIWNIWRHLPQEEKLFHFELGYLFVSRSKCIKIPLVCPWFLRACLGETKAHMIQLRRCMMVPRERYVQGLDKVTPKSCLKPFPHVNAVCKSHTFVTPFGLPPMRTQSSQVVIKQIKLFGNLCFVDSAPAFHMSLPVMIKDTKALGTFLLLLIRLRFTRHCTSGDQTNQMLWEASVWCLFACVYCLPKNACSPAFIVCVYCLLSGGTNGLHALIL